MSKSSKAPQKMVYRDDGNGKFITEEGYKKAPPATVTKEKVPIAPHVKKKK